MKKLTAISVIFVAAVFVLGGCGDSQSPDGSNLQGSAFTTQQKVAVKSGAQEVMAPTGGNIFKSLLDFNNYNQSKLTNFSFTCSDTNATDLLNRIESQKIYEKNISGSENYKLIIYRTQNPDNLDTEGFKAMFANCKQSNSIAPIQATSEYLLWSNFSCTADKGISNDANFSKCKSTASKLKSL